MADILSINVPPTEAAADNRVAVALSEIAALASTIANLLINHDPDHTKAAECLALQIGALADAAKGIFDAGNTTPYRGDLTDWIAPWLRADAS